MTRMLCADDAEDTTFHHPTIAKFVAGLVAVALIGWSGMTSASADEVSIAPGAVMPGVVAAANPEPTFENPPDGGTVASFGTENPGEIVDPADVPPGSGDVMLEPGDDHPESGDDTPEPEDIEPPLEDDASDPADPVPEPDDVEQDLDDADLESTSDLAAPTGTNALPERAAAIAAAAATVCTATTQPQLDACFAQTATDLDIIINPVSGTNINRNTGLTDFRITIPAGQNVTISGASSGFRITGAYFVVNGSLTITGLGLTTNSTQTAAQQLPLVQVNSGGVFTLDNGGSITGNGSGAINAASGATVDILTGSTISGNTGGGAINLLSGSTLTMSGGTISGNTSTTGGGAINMAAGSIADISGGTITGNSSSTGGGAINLASNTATLNLTGGTISYNTATGTADGGAIFVTSAAAAANRAVVTISDTTFSNNTAAGGSGGAIYLSNWATLNLTDCTFTANVAGSGGAIGSNNNVTVNLQGSHGNQLTGNQATNSGGAIAIGTTSTLTANAGTNFSGNSAATGGAISTGTNSTVTITGATIQSNSATTNGGGMIVASGTQITLNGTTVEHNTAGNDGGGIYLSQGYGKLQITGNSAFTNNTATTAGGAIWLRYVSPAAGGNELANLFITDAVTFSGNSAGTPSPIRNPLDDAIYASNIEATVWSSDQSGIAMSQGYNNYDIAYSYTPPIPPQYPAAPFPMPFTGETITTWPYLAAGLVILIAGAAIQAILNREPQHRDAYPVGQSKGALL